MIRGNLQDFRLVLAEISAVCDISAQEERLEQNDQQVLKMQGNILGPLEQLLQAVVVRMLTLQTFGLLAISNASVWGTLSGISVLAL